MSFISLLRTLLIHLHAIYNSIPLFLTSIQSWLSITEIDSISMDVGSRVRHIADVNNGEDAKKVKLDSGNDCENRSDDEDLDTDDSDDMEIDDPDYFSDEDYNSCGLDEVSLEIDKNIDWKGKKKNVAILSSEDLKQEMNKLVSLVEQQLSIPSPTSHLLLKQFGWDADKLFEQYCENLPEYFANLGIFLPKNDDDEPDENNIQNEETTGVLGGIDEEIDCVICYVPFNPNTVPCYPPCAHVICGGCTLEYLRTRISGETMECTVQCPITKCKALLDQKYIHNFLQQTPDVLAMYEKLTLEDFVKKTDNVKFCPYPGCENSWKMNMESMIYNDEDCDGGQEVACKCQENFCFRCTEPWHFPLKCDLMKCWLQRVAEDSLTANWIKANAKNCPNKQCNAIIEKNGGCNVMTCRKCKLQFCWICLVEWGKHKGDIYACNKVANSSEAAESKNQIQWFTTHWEKFSVHRESYKLEKNMLDNAGTRMEHIQQFNESSKVLHALWYLDAIQVLLACRRMLQFSFAFVYYLVKNSQVHIFETNLHNLHDAVETLSGYLEQNMGPAELAQNQQKVLNLTNFCKARRSVMIEHVEEGYRKSLWEFRNDLVKFKG